MARRADRRRSAAAFALSVAAHALLFALLLSLVRAPAPAAKHRHQPIPFTVELRPMPPRPLRPPTAATPVPIAPGRRLAAGGRHGGRPALGVPGGGAGQGARPAPGTPEWRSAEGVGGAGSLGGGGAGSGLALGPRGVRDGLAVGVGPEYRDPSLPEDEATSAARAKGFVDRYVADAKARERAVYFPDPYWMKMREKLGHAFKPEWSVLDKGPKGDGAGGTVRGAMRDLKEMLSDWSDHAEQYAKTGNPGGKWAQLGEHRSLQDDVLGLQTEAHGNTTARDLFRAARPENSLFDQELVTLVAITQAPDGRVLGIEVLEGSGNGAYDAMALEQAKAMAQDAVSELGPAPAQGRKTLWAFDTNFVIVPPVPMVTCGFDAYFRPTECYYPLEHLVRPRVELKAIY